MMTRLARNRIVGIGEAVLTERDGRAVVDGLAIEVARWAAKCGHIGIPVSRLGQDERAGRILEELKQQQIDISHMQSDPDLPTARRVIRSIAGRSDAGVVRMDDRAAFDNMQWDFDLVDVAQEADAVVFGMVAQRGGTSSSVISRFLSEATGALRILDLTNRTSDDFDRQQALRNMDAADVAIIDPVAAGVLLRRSVSSDVTGSQTMSRLLSIGSIAMLVTVDYGEPVTVCAGEVVSRTSVEWSSADHALMRIAMVHSQLRGDDPEATAAVLDRLISHVRQHEDESIPESVLQ